MTEPQDPLAALAAAAKSRPAGKSRPAPRAIAAKPQPKSIRTSRLPKRPQKSRAPIYIALAAFALVIIAAIIITIVMLNPGQESTTAKTHNAAPTGDGPGDLFRNVKPK